MNINLKLKLKILAVIAISFLTVKLLAPQVFLANTPRVNPLFIAKLKNIPANIAQKSSSSTTQSKNNQIATNTGHSGPYVTSQPITGNTDTTAPAGSTPLPISEQEVSSSLDKLASVTPPAQAAFVPVASGVSTYTDSSTNKTILKIEKGAQYTVERYQLANGEIKDIIVIK